MRRPLLWTLFSRCVTRCPGRFLSEDVPPPGWAPTASTASSSWATACSTWPWWTTVRACVEPNFVLCFHQCSRDGALDALLEFVGDDLVSWLESQHDSRRVPPTQKRALSLTGRHVHPAEEGGAALARDRTLVPRVPRVRPGRLQQIGPPANGSCRPPRPRAPRATPLLPA